MKNVNHLALSLIVGSCALGLTGCNVGMAPAGMSNDEAKAAIDRMPPEKKIRFIAGSPMNQVDKEKKYKEIEEQTGVKASDVLGQQPTPPGGGG